MYGRSVCGNQKIHTPDGTGFADWRSTRSGRPGGGNTEVRLTHRWREMDSNLYGAFPVKWCFSVYCQFFVRRLKGPFFIPSPTIRFLERAQWGQGSETLSKAWRLAA